MLLVIKQWGYKKSATTDVTFPIAFTSTPYFVLAADIAGDTNTGGLNLIAIPHASYFSSYTRASNASTRWSGWQTDAGVIASAWIAGGK